MAYSHDQIQGQDECLFVLSGELRGVSVPVGSEPICVGSSADCDVVLLDGIAEESAICISVDEKKRYALTDAIGDVRVGGKSVKPGKRRALKAGVPLKVGSVDLMITKSLTVADQAERSRQRRSTGMVWAASLVGAIGLIGAVGLAGGLGIVSAKPAPFEDRRTADTKLSSLTAVVAADAMRAKLDENGLMRLQAVADRQNSTVMVRGKIRESEQGLWRATSTWFDTVYGETVFLDAHVSTSADTVTLPFSVSAVWMGSSPRLTLHDGSHRYAGDTLPGGWQLDKIESNSVTISRDGESLMVPL